MYSPSLLKKKNERKTIFHIFQFVHFMVIARSFPPDGTTFSQITLGQKLSKQIPPYSYWNMQFYQSEPAYVKFDYNIPRGASIGVYARRNALPTHTQYHFKEVLSGFNARTTRSTHVSLPTFFSLSLVSGLTFTDSYVGNVVATKAPTA